jgi:hypothetical protein
MSSFEIEFSKGLSTLFDVHLQQRLSDNSKQDFKRDRVRRTGLIGSNHARSMSISISISGFNEICTCSNQTNLDSNFENRHNRAALLAKIASLVMQSARL